MNMTMYRMYMERGSGMTSVAVRHKHLRLDQGKLSKVKRILGSATETEALDRAMDLVLAEAEILKTLRSVRSKGRIVRVMD